MAQAIRYRTGIDPETGQFLFGRDDLLTSLKVIWSTRPGERLMRLQFGTDLRPFLAEDITPTLALEIYNELAIAVEKEEPEYRLDHMQFVKLTADGVLGLRHGGRYFPEGRFGNYDIAVPITAMPERFGLARAS